MVYRFNCEKCNDKKLLKIPMSEYDGSKEYLCEDCGEVIKRDINDFCSNNTWKCDGAYGKSS